MVPRRGSLIWGDVPRSLVSLILGILAIIAIIVTIAGMDINLIEFGGGSTQEDLRRTTNTIIGLVTGFGFGMVSWMVGFIAFPTDKSHPRWRTCKICSSLGIGFGILAILIYLVIMLLVPTPVIFR